MSGRSASGSCACGARSSSTMIVMMIAMTPSLKASSRFGDITPTVLNRRRRFLRRTPELSVAAPDLTRVATHNVPLGLSQACEELPHVRLSKPLTAISRANERRPEPAVWDAGRPWLCPAGSGTGAREPAQLLAGLWVAAHRAV